MSEAKLQIQMRDANAHELLAVNLEAERNQTRPLYIMKITRSSNLGAKDSEHKKAEPYVARKLRNETRKIFLNSTKDNKEEYAGEIGDDDFQTVYRGNMGFTVNSPKNIYDVLSITQGFGIMITSSTNITYELTFAKYSGKAIMKAKDKEVRNFGFGEIPPTAMQHAGVNTIDSVRSSFKNALISGGMQATTIEPRKNANDKMTNEWRIEWSMPLTIDRFKLYHAMKVDLASGDQGTIKFSSEFCKKYDLHQYCGRPNKEKPMAYGRDDHYGPSECMFCEPKGSSSGRGKANIGKRSFDAMFSDLN